MTAVSVRPGLASTRDSNVVLPLPRNPVSTEIGSGACGSGGAGRFISAPWLGLLDNDVWLRNARHANAMARRLCEAVSDVPGITVTRAPTANAVFAVLPRAARERLQQEFDF